SAGLRRSRSGIWLWQWSRPPRIPAAPVPAWRRDFSRSAAAGDDRLHQARDNVVDMAGESDAWGDGGCRAKLLDVAGDRGDGVQDRSLRERGFVGACPVRVSAAEAL